jgi:hypothetical protein
MPEKLYPDGSIYNGELNKEGLANGQGTLTEANGFVYKGEFKNDAINGQGTYTSADGFIYVGEFKDGIRHGQGTLTLTTGESYFGEWNNDSLKGFYKDVEGNIREFPMLRDAFSSLGKFAKRTLSLGSEKLSDSIEGIKDMSSKKHEEFNEYINKQARKRVENDYKKVGKVWQNEISPSDFLIKVAEKEKIILDKAKKRGFNAALSLTGLSFLRPKSLFKQFFDDDEDFDDTEV